MHSLQRIDKTGRAARVEHAAHCHASESGIIGQRQFLSAVAVEFCNNLRKRLLSKYKPPLFPACSSGDVGPACEIAVQAADRQLFARCHYDGLPGWRCSEPSRIGIAVWDLVDADLAFDQRDLHAAIFLQMTVEVQSKEHGEELQHRINKHGFEFSEGA